MKIMGMDNFGRENVSEFFPSNAPTMVSTNDMQNWCDARNSDHSSFFFKLVEDDYELFIWRP